jgi:hypothetical protein
MQPILMLGGESGTRPLSNIDSVSRPKSMAVPTSPIKRLADPGPFLQVQWIRIERFFNRIKQCRRVATRYDKLAANYLAFVQLASIRLWLRAYESTP